jgi:hypothetical protein
VRVLLACAAVTVVLAVCIWSESVYQFQRSIMLASANNDVDFLQRAASLHANLDFVDTDFKETPLALAVENQSYQAAEFLVSHGALARRKTPNGSPIELARDDKMRRILKKARDWPSLASGPPSQSRAAPHR